jgi:hypothetical protein
MFTARYTDLTGKGGGLHVPAALVARRPGVHPPYRDKGTDELVRAVEGVSEGGDGAGDRRSSATRLSDRDLRGDSTANG